MTAFWVTPYLGIITESEDSLCTERCRAKYLPRATQDGYRAYEVVASKELSGHRTATLVAKSFPSCVGGDSPSYLESSWAARHRFPSTIRERLRFCFSNAKP